MNLDILRVIRNNENVRYPLNTMFYYNPDIEMYQNTQVNEDIGDNSMSREEISLYFSPSFYEGNKECFLWEGHEGEDTIDEEISNLNTENNEDNNINTKEPEEKEEVEVEDLQDHEIAGNPFMPKDCYISEEEALEIYKIGYEDGRRMGKVPGISFKTFKLGFPFKY